MWQMTYINSIDTPPGVPQGAVVALVQRERAVDFGREGELRLLLEPQLFMQLAHALSPLGKRGDRSVANGTRRHAYGAGAWCWRSGASTGVCSNWLGW